MMKGTPHQPISEAPLDEEQRESKGLTPENPKEEKVAAAKTPLLKGQYVTAEALLDCADFDFGYIKTKSTLPLHPYCSGYSNNWSSSRGGGYRGGSRSAGRGSRPAPSVPAVKRPGFMALPTPQTAARPFLKPTFSHL